MHIIARAWSAYRARHRAFCERQHADSAFETLADPWERT